MKAPRTVVHEENPPFPRHETDRRERVIIGPDRGPAFVLTSGSTVLCTIDGRDVTTEQALAYVLDGFHLGDGGSSGSWALWSGSVSSPKLVAVFLPHAADGRRSVLLFDGHRAARHVFPPHLDYEKNLAEALA